MNGYEERVINEIGNMTNIAFWTRNIERKGFRINGFVNHYPDFIIQTKSGKTILLETKGENIHILPANIDLAAAEVQLVNEVAREHVLADVLKPVIDDYDLILIDCQPSLGLLTVNALTASHGVLIPLACEFFALRGVALLLDTVEKVKARLNPNLQLDGILPTMYDPRTLHSVEVLELVTKNRPKDVLKSIIRRTVKFPDSTVAAAPITVFAPEHQAAESYRELARELISLGKIA